MPAPIPQAAITVIEAAYPRMMVKFLTGKLSRSVNS
jgi:hypothetical protein